MFHWKTEILTSNGWMRCAHLHDVIKCHGGVDVATVVSNSLVYTKVSKSIEKTGVPECGMIQFSSNEEDAMPSLSVSSDNQICYSTSSDGDILISKAGDLCGKGNIFIPKSIFIPDGIEVDPDLQEYISTMGLMAILYLYAESFEKGHVILRSPSELYLNDLSTHAGFLRLKAEEFEDNRVVLDLSPTIFGLSPISISVNQVIKDTDSWNSEASRVFPQWFFNAHPYAQKEFVKIILEHLGKLDKDSAWIDLPKEHIDKIVAIGIQCGVPISGVSWSSLREDECKSLVAKEIEAEDGYHYEFIVEPTNTLCIRQGEESFICSGGNPDG